MGQSYPVETIAEMAAIPEDRLPLFLEELPDILRMVRQREEVQAHLRTILGDANLEYQKITWVDDGAKNVTVNFFVSEPDQPPEEIGSLVIKGGA